MKMIYVFNYTISTFKRFTYPIQFLLNNPICTAPTVTTTKEKRDVKW